MATASISVETSIQKIAALENDQIHESSGIALSTRDDAVLWTHNDSGDSARIFALDLQGRHLAEVAIEDATFRDVEDITSFKKDGKSWLLIGDIGDNLSRHNSCTLYLIEEPTVGTVGAPASTTVSVSRTFEYRYEDGPQDCETLAVDPETNTIYLVEKNTFSVKDAVATIYELPWPHASNEDVLTAKAIGTMSFPVDMSPGGAESEQFILFPFTTTAGAISRDGSRFIVLTYTVAYEYVRDEGESWADAFRQAPRKLPMPGRRQGESICYAADGQSLYLTSEKLPTPLWKVLPAD